MNHYEALGVPVDASAAEIRQAYLRAAREHHPDFHAAAEEAVRRGHARRMQAVNEAWQVLGQADTRARYDRDLDLDLGRPATGTGADRARPGEPLRPPPGKGWTPRSDDVGWQQDFRSWADEDERLPPDAPAPTGGRRASGILAVVPVALFALGVLCGFLGLVLTSRELLAAAFIAVAVSASLFVMLPFIEMSRGRHQD